MKLLLLENSDISSTSVFTCRTTGGEPGSIEMNGGGALRAHIEPTTESIKTVGSALSLATRRKVPKARAHESEAGPDIETESRAEQLRGEG